MPLPELLKCDGALVTADFIWAELVVACEEKFSFGGGGKQGLQKNLNGELVAGLELQKLPPLGAEIGGGVGVALAYTRKTQAASAQMVDTALERIEVRLKERVGATVRE